MSDGGSVSLGELVAILTLKDLATPALNDAGAAINKMLGEHAKSFRALSTAAGAVFGSVLALGRAIIGMGEEGSRVLGIEARFASLNKEVGNSSDTVDRLMEAFGGAVDDTDIMTTVINTFSMGVKASTEDLEKMARGARVLAKGGMTDAGQAFQMLNMALATGRDRSLRMIGLNAQLAKGTAEYARSIGKQKDELTQTQLVEARRITMMKALDEQLKKNGAIQDTFATRVKAARIAVDDFFEELQKAVARSPALNVALDEISKAIRGVFGGKEADKVAEEFQKAIGETAIILAQFGLVALQVAGHVIALWNGAKIVFAAFGGAASAWAYLFSMNIQFVLKALELLVTTLGELPATKFFEEFLPKPAFVDTIKGTFQQLKANIEDMKDVNREGMSAFGKEVDGAVEQHLKAQSAIKGMEGVLGKTITAMRAAESAQKKVKEETQDATKKIDEEATAMGKATTAALAFSKGLQDSIREMDAGNVSPLFGALEKVNTQVAGMYDKIRMEMKGATKGAIMEAEAAVADYRDRLIEAAVAGERQKAVGQTFEDVNKEVLSIWQGMALLNNGLADLTDSGLQDLEKKLTELDKITPLVGMTGMLTAVRAQMKALGMQTSQELANSEHVAALQEEYQARMDKDEDDRLAALEAQRAQWEEIYGIVGDFAGMLGDVLPEDMQNVAGALDDAVSMAEQFDSTMKDGKVTMEGYIGLAMQLPGAFLRATDSASGLSRALGAAQIGVSVGRSIGQAFGPAGAVTGAVIGGMVGAMAGLAREPGWVRAGREAGAAFGFEVSEEMARAIEERAHELDISIGSSTLLSISDAMEESGRTADTFRTSIEALFQQMQQGLIPAHEGMDQLDEIFQQAARSAEELGGEAQRLAGRMIQQALATGYLTQSMRQYIDQTLDRVAAASRKIAEGLAMIPKNVNMGQMGADAAQMFVFGFAVEIAKNGVVATILDQADEINAMYDRFEREGNTAALALLAPFAELANVLTDEAHPALRGFLTTLEGMNDMLAELDNLGYATVEAFDMLTNAVNQTNQAMLDAGVSELARLQALAPELGRILDLHNRYGFIIDANTQALIDQATAAGIAFPTDPLMVMIDLLTSIAMVLGATIPAAAQNAANAIRGIPSASGLLGGGNPNPDTTSTDPTRNGSNQNPGPRPSNYPPGMPWPPTNVPHMAMGGIVRRPTFALIGEDGPEEVVPLGKGRTIQHISLNVNANPMQTAETVEQMNTFVMNAVRRDISRDLAGLVERGEA